MPDPENRGRLKRFLLFLLGVALIPALWAAVLAVCDQFPALLTSSMPFIAPEPLAFAAGYALWTLLFLFLPPAIKMYVWGHELTHALWGLMTGSKVGKIKVGDNGGYVNLTNPGIFTTLAPYFVPQEARSGENAPQALQIKASPGGEAGAAKPCLMRW